MKNLLSRREVIARGTSSIAAAGLCGGLGFVPTATRASASDSLSIRHRRVAVNGVHLHLSEAGTGPAVILLHGVPELWYSWRHQLPALARAGYHAIAPDLRGCGESDAPKAIDAYSMRNMTADVVGILDDLGIGRAVIAGHDWGASIAWACAELHPERVQAVIALSVPYHPRPSSPPTQQIAKFANGHFSFVTYFQRVGVAEAELSRDPRQSLRRFFYAFSGDAPPNTIPYLFMKKPAGAGVLDGMPDPAQFPSWLTASDLDYYAGEYARTGFSGILNLYRNMDRDWTDLPELGATGIKQPALFVGGTRDSPVMFGSFDPMIRAVPNLRNIAFLPGCGHWTQQERPESVNAAIVAFIRDVASWEG